MTLRTLLLSALLVTGASAALTAPASAEAPIYTSAFSNVAVQGYDPVAYFTDGKPVKGKATFKTTHQGAEFTFASQANLDAFKADPAKYTPQYGGYCAWAVSQGYTAKGDARYWKIVDGKLYLNYNKQVQTTWEGDVPGFVTSANANWPKVIQ